MGHPSKECLSAQGAHCAWISQHQLTKKTTGGVFGMVTMMITVSWKEKKRKEKIYRYCTISYYRYPDSSAINYWISFFRWFLGTIHGRNSCDGALQPGLIGGFTERNLEQTASHIQPKDNWGMIEWLSLIASLVRAENGFLSHSLAQSQPCLFRLETPFPSITLNPACYPGWGHKSEKWSGRHGASQTSHFFPRYLRRNLNFFFIPLLRT